MFYLSTYTSSYVFVPSSPCPYSEGRQTLNPYKIGRKTEVRRYVDIPAEA